MWNATNWNASYWFSGNWYLGPDGDAPVPALHPKWVIRRLGLGLGLRYRLWTPNQ